jgi:hypothetical protein
MAKLAAEIAWHTSEQIMDRFHLLQETESFMKNLIFTSHLEEP